jgi:hypothetical protein
MSSEDIKQLMNQGTEQSKILLIQEYIKQLKGVDVEIHIHPFHIEQLYQYAESYFNKILGTVIVTGELKRYRLVKQ